MTYGCHNRREFATIIPVQEGWFMDGQTRLPRMVAPTFVATVGNPAVKDKQNKNWDASASKKVVESDSAVQPEDMMPNEQVKSDFTPPVGQDFGTDKYEPKATQSVERTDREVSMAQIPTSRNKLVVAS